MYLTSKHLNIHVEMWIISCLFLVLILLFYRLITAHGNSVDAQCKLNSRTMNVNAKRVCLIIIQYNLEQKENILPFSAKFGAISRGCDSMRVCWLCIAFS